MKLLKDNVIHDHYDVIVVGAGIGGMTAAALLAKKGLKVLTVEQHYLPGGCCTAIRRKDIAMDVGAAMLFGWDGEDEAHQYVMNELEEEIDMISHDSTYRMHLGDKTLTFWRDLDRFLNELIALFPHQEKGIRALYAECMDTYEIMTDMAKIPVPPTELPLMDGLKAGLKNPMGMVKMQKLMSMSGEDLLLKHITDPKLASFYDFLIAVCTTCNVKESPASTVIGIFVGTHKAGACYPSGSPQMLPNKIEKAYEKWGGQTIYRQKVEEVLMWKGGAYGVRLEDGTEITSDCVISNADIWNLYGTLVKAKHIDDDRMEWAQKFVPTPGIFMVYLTVKEAAIPEGTRSIEFFVNNVNDVLGGNIIIYIPSIADPSIAPTGTHSITIMAPSKTEWPRPADRLYRSEEYNKMKTEEGEEVIDLVEGLIFPDLRENIITLDIGTPSTIERFTMKSFGNIGGPKLTIKQGFFNRLKAKSDWKNLYCVGDSTAMGEGVISATMSGVGAANQILKDRRLPTYGARKFPKKYVNIIHGHGHAWTETPDPSEPITEESIKRIGRDCQHCEEPGCEAACPAGLDACQFARRIEAGNFIGAARVVRETNPLSEICGQICPAERFCEKECKRLDFDEKPVRIKELHGWVCGHVSPFDGWDRYLPPHNGKKIAVVGAGPAGLTCAHYLARLGYKVDIIEKGKKPGGMLANAIPSFRMPDDIVEREIDGLTLPHMNFKYNEALGKDYSIADLEEEYNAVFLAPGLSEGRKLKIGGKKGPAALDALSVLNTYREKGKIKVGKNVLIIGGGSVAADAALVVKDSGAAKVSVICLENEAEMPALPQEVAELKKQGIEIHNGWGPKSFLSASKMSFIGCKSVFDSLGSFNPVFDESRTIAMEFDQLIWAVGQTVESKLAKYLQKEFGQEGLLTVDEKTCQIKGRPGIYAGGDIVRGAGTVVEAVADGRRAAMAIDTKIKGKFI